jgi:hypothetical protein
MCLIRMARVLVVEKRHGQILLPLAQPSTHATCRFNQQVAGAGFSGAGAMFRSFTQSARDVLRRILSNRLSDSHIIELRSSKLNLSAGTCHVCHFH